MNTRTFLFEVLLTLLTADALCAQQIGTDPEKGNTSSYFLQMQLGAMAFVPNWSSDMYLCPYVMIGCVGKISIIPSMGAYWRISTGISDGLSKHYDTRPEAPFYHLDVNLFVDFGEHSTIPDMSSAMSAGISMIKPLDDEHSIGGGGSTSASWITSNWINTLHLHFSFAFRFHPSIIELFVRIPWTKSIQWYSNYDWVFDREGHIFLGLSYAHLIGL